MERLSVKIKSKYFTGFRDKNGKKIYSGDSVKFRAKRKAMLNYNGEYNYRVVWHEDEEAFVIADSSDGAYFNKFTDVCAIELCKPS